jgi:Fe-S cluster assembly protein SufB
MNTQTSIAEQQAYTPGFRMAEKYVFESELGLSRKIVEQISEMKGEPTWMRTFRLRSLEIFEKRPMPSWGADLSGIDFEISGD